MAKRNNNPHFIRATVHNELLAGHHLLFFMNKRFEASPNFNTPFWIQGNAVYWEFLLWDLEFPQSSEDKIGMVLWWMHRWAGI